VLVDAVDGALETRTVVGVDVPSGARAVELAPNRLTDKNVDELMQLLGRGNRKSLCDCDRTSSPNLRRPIYLMSRPDILGADGRLSRLVRAGLTPDAIVNEFYLVTLSRPPDDNERALALAHISQASEPKSGLADIVWALINTREFGTNH
jgi:hypothetical protein